MYLINNCIIFDVCNQTILHRENGVMRNLTDIQARILTCLIKNVGVATERNVLLNYVWRDETDKASNNTLNHNISFLRRIFHQTYCNDVILTIHGSGYLLNAKVDLLPAPEKSKIQPHNNVIFLILINKISSKAIKYIAIAILSFSITFDHTRGVSTRQNKNISRNYVLNNINGCNVIAIKKTNSNTNAIYDFIRKNKIICSNSQFFLLIENYHKNSNGEDKRNSFFIAKCNKINFAYENCYNWFVREEEVE